MTFQNLRPGVYSRYDITSAYTAPLSLKYAAVAAKSPDGEAGTLYRFKSFAEACEIFMPDENGVVMRTLISVLFSSGVSEVLAVPVVDGYEDAFAVLETAENVGAIVCDATDAADLLLLSRRAEENSLALRECLAFCGIDDAQQAADAAKEINSERLIITCPAVSAKNTEAHAAVIAAAALAGKILATGDAAANFAGLAFPVLENPVTMPESDIQALLGAGVTVFENVGGNVECIRALTTKTTKNGVSDRSMTGINTVLIIDDIMTSMRSSLKLRLTGGRINGSPLDSIRSQVAVVLASKQNDGLIESFETPRCYPDASDPEVCVVEISFKIARVVSQIHLVAHISI